MKPKSRTILLVGLALAAFVVLYFVSLRLMNRSRPKAGWLAVEGPSAVAPDTTLDFRVTLGTIPEPRYIDGLLTLVGSRGEPLASQNLLETVPAVHSGGTYDLKFPLKAKEGLKSVYVIIVLSPVRDWKERTHAAFTEPIPVVSADEAARLSTTKVITAFSWGLEWRGRGGDAQVTRGHRFRRSDETPIPVRWTLFFLLAFGAALSLILSSRTPRPGAGKGRASAVFRAGLGVFLFLAGVGELLAFDERLTDFFRQIARENHFYYIRRSIQVAIILLIIIGAVSLFLLSIAALRHQRLRFRTWLAAMGLTAYAAVSLAQIVSLHYVDHFANVLIAGIPFIDIAKGVGILMILAGLLLNVLGKRPPDITPKKAA